MKIKTLFIIVGGVTIVLLAVGVAGVIAQRQPAVPSAVGATLSGGISYQGRLTNAAGGPLSGTYTMRFVVYDDPGAGSALWDSGDLDVAVEDGLFNVKLGVDPADFDGQALWLSIVVDGETLAPRQEILPAPYALSLRPGADVVGDSLGAADASLAGYAPATGTALYADANGGVGLFGDSENNYGVWGSSNSSWGGYFTSDGGYGIRVHTDGATVNDHGAYVTSDRGYGVYAQSAQNQAVRGEAGDVTGFPPVFGRVGVVGMGENRGVHGGSNNGLGVYGTSGNSYGLWGQSTNYRGATGRTNRSDNNYGLFTPDNLFSLNINVAGAVMAVMQNGGVEPLSPGDVVVFSGITDMETAVDGPLVQVSKARVAGSTAVAGVVHSRFNIDAINPQLEAPDDSARGTLAAVEVTPAGSAAPGEYVLVVVQGPARVRASALGGEEIRPGDLLSAAGAAGVAGKAPTMAVDGVETAVPGAVFGKALEAVDDDQAMIYVYVTLQ